MSRPLEHDHMGSSEPCLSNVCKDDDGEKASDNVVVNHLKETELRLGLPGSEFPERKSLTPLNNNNNYNFGVASGANKRGFSDAIFGSGKWDLSINGGSCLNLSKDNNNLFSPKANNGGSKDGLPSSSTKPAEVKKTPVNEHSSAPASKAQVVGWPPIRSFRKNTLATNISKNTTVEEKSGSGCLYVKVSMDGAPYLRKVDLKTCCNYTELSSALEKMFSCFTIGHCASHGISGKEGLIETHLMDLLHGSEYVLTYEDKDGDWMLVGDVPWGMFMDSCKRLRIMRSTDAIGLAPRTTQKCKNQNKSLK